MKTEKIICSVGVCVYNEGKNIGNLIDTLLTQKLRSVRIGEIVVIASGTTDDTIHIVERHIKRSKKIRLIREKRRSGKASAVNIFVHNAKYDVLMLLGGDLLLENNTVQHLVGKFKQAEVGMTGARPFPVNKNAGLTGRAAHLLWDLHHRVSLQHPKMGEVVAFRKIFKRIPVLSSVDEANIEPLIRGQGYKILYVPQAKIHNKAPTTIRDFIRQRRRIYNGHLAVKNEQSYVVSTYRLGSILLAISGVIRDNPSLSTFVGIATTAGLEGFSRFLGWWDYRISRKRHTVWKIVSTTKNPAG